MPPITVTTEINRPADDVFAYATDPTRFAQWQKGVVDGHLDEPGHPNVGTKCVTTRRIGFANRPTTGVVTHLDPPKTWRMRGIDGPIRANVDVTVEALTDTRSQLTIAVDFECQCRTTSQSSRNASTHPLRLAVKDPVAECGHQPKFPLWVGCEHAVAGPKAG